MGDSWELNQINHGDCLDVAIKVNNTIKVNNKEYPIYRKNEKIVLQITFWSKCDVPIVVTHINNLFKDITLIPSSKYPEQHIERDKYIVVDNDLILFNLILRRSEEKTIELWVKPKNDNPEILKIDFNIFFKLPSLHKEPEPFPKQIKIYREDVVLKHLRNRELVYIDNVEEDRGKDIDISLSNYDAVIIALGLGFDKRKFQHLIEVFASRGKKVKDKNFNMPKLFLDHLSDAQAALAIFKWLAENNNIPVFMIYGDAPFTENFFIEHVYLKPGKAGTIDYKNLRSAILETKNEAIKNKTFRLWGYEHLSFVLRNILDKINQVRHTSKERLRIYIDKSDETELKTLLDYAAGIEGYTKADDVSVADIIISKRKLDKSLEVFIGYVVSHINESQLFQILENKEKVAIITLGGPEHNIFLRYFITKDRGKRDQVLFDESNAWDRKKFYLLGKKAPRILLVTHDFVGIELTTSSGDIVSFKRGSSGKGGCIILIKRNLWIGNEERSRQIDLWSVVGSGVGGAVATKLGAIALVTNKFKIGENQKFKIFYNELEVNFSNNLLQKFSAVEPITAFLLNKLSKDDLKVLARWEEATSAVSYSS